MKRKKNVKLQTLSRGATPDRDILRVHQIEILEIKSLEGEKHNKVVIRTNGDEPNNGIKTKLWDALVHTIVDRTNAIADDIKGSLAEQEAITIEQDRSHLESSLHLEKIKAKMETLKGKILSIKGDSEEKREIRRTLIETINK